MAIADIGDFVKVDFTNGTTPPINATNLDALENRVQDIDDWISAGGAVGATSKAFRSDYFAGVAVSSAGRAAIVSTGTVTALDVTGKNLILLNPAGTGSLEIQGLTGGTTGQTVRFLKLSTADTIILKHNHASGTEKLFLTGGADVTLTTVYGNFTATYDGSNWFLSI
jgi:hypothetical protein